MNLVIGLIGLVTASYGGLLGIPTGLTKSTDHPSILYILRRKPTQTKRGTFLQCNQGASMGPVPGILIEPVHTIYTIGAQIIDPIRIQQGPITRARRRTRRTLEGPNCPYKAAAKLPHL